MNLQHLRHRIQKSLAQRGTLGTMAVASKKLFRRRPKTSEPPKSYLPVHPFDEQFGVDTSGLIPPEELRTGRREDLFNTGYFGVAPSAFRQILEQLPIEFEMFTFVDLGSGKGRALFVAAEYPFREIIGVELSPKLHAIAATNITRYRSPSQRCWKISSIMGDATKFAFPSGPLVIYLWNSFDGHVFDRVLANIEAALKSEPRELYILYIQPDLDALFERSEFLRKLWRREFQISAEDYAAHAFPPRVEICCAYQSIPPRTTPLTAPS